MKGNKAVFMVVIIAILAISAIVGSITVFFKNNQTQSGHAMEMVGIVAIKNDAEILVISGKNQAELEGLSEEEMLEGTKEAIWFSLSIDQAQQVKEFDKVRITYSHVSESFPARASANGVKVMTGE